MSDRERWIVYPLLFLALGSSISTKMLMQQQVETQYFKCRTITMESVDGETRFGLVAQDGTLLVQNLNTHEVWPLVGSPHATALEALRRSFQLQQPDRSRAPTEAPRGERNTNEREKTAE